MFLTGDRSISLESGPLAVGELGYIKPGGGHGQLTISSMNRMAWKGAARPVELELA